MTEPVSNVNAQDFGTAVQELVAQAKKLGLTWDLRPATIVDGSEPNSVQATYDGDVTPLFMSSLIGVLNPQKRVQVIAIPPAGHFIVGEIGVNVPSLFGQAGTQLVSFGPATSTTVVVTFPYPFDVAPSVSVNINSASGATANFHCRAYDIQTTQFTIFIFGAASVTWTNIPVTWIAARQTQ